MNQAESLRSIIEARLRLSLRSAGRNDILADDDLFERALDEELRLFPVQCSLRPGAAVARATDAPATPQPQTQTQNSMPPTVEIVRPDIQNLNAAFEQKAECRLRFLAGAAIHPRELTMAAMATALLYALHRPQIMAVIREPVLGSTNTIPAELQRVAIFQEAMRTFAVRLVPLKIFSTRFNSVPLQGTNKIELPFYDLDTQASTDFVQADGYTFGENTTTGVRELLINKRKYKSLSLTSAELARQPMLDRVKLATLKGEKLAIDVLADILGNITAANFPQHVSVGPPSAFDSEDVQDLETAADKAYWPDTGRSLLMDSDYDNALSKDPSLKSALNYDGAEVIRGGEIPEIAGFSYFESPSIPDNGEALKGIAASAGSGLLVATSPIMPGAGVRKVTDYEVIVHPELGIAFEYRSWGVAQADSDFEVIECNYGAAKGNAGAILRVVGS